MLGKINADHASSVFVAYEPDWAICTGKTAGPDQAQEMHAFIRKDIEAIWNAEVAQNTSILYGGSCNSGNADALFSCADVATVCNNRLLFRIQGKRGSLKYLSYKAEWLLTHSRNSTVMD